MSLLLKPGDPEPLTIGDRTYYLAVPTTVGRVRFRKLVTEAGGRQHGQLRLLDALAASVSKLMAQDEVEMRNALLAKIRAHREALVDYLTFVVQNEAALMSAGLPVDDPLRVEFRTRSKAVSEGATGLQGTEAIVIENDPAYAAMVADDQAFATIKGIAAANCLLVGWNGSKPDGTPIFDGKPERANNLLSEDSLAQIPEGDFPIIAAKAESLCSLSAAQKKASVSPVPAASAGETSTTS